MKNKKVKLKTIIVIFIWTLLIILIPYIVSKIKDNRFENNQHYISSQFEVNDYSIILDVNKNNKIDVTEKLTINVPNDSEFNGIYKSIPLFQKYYDQNGKKIEKRVKVSNLREMNEKFILNNSIDKIGIRIGSTRTTINKGLHTYTIKYRYDMGTDTYNNLDKMTFNIFDNYDNTSVNNMSVIINMPKDIENEKILFLKDNQDITDSVNCTIDKNSVKATLGEKLLNNNLTVEMILPNNYFIGTANNYGFISLFISVIIILFSIVSFILWKKYGRNYNKKFKTVEFYPPDNLDSAQAGYIYGEKSIKKLTTALIIQLASKGYIAIDEIQKSKYKITNIGKDKTNLKKLSINEQIIYIELFKNSDENILSEDKSFFEVFAKLNSSLETIFDKKINDIKSRKMKYISFSMLFISIIGWIISYAYIRDIDPRFNYIYFLSFIAIYITGLFAIIMNRKTEYGEVITAKVLGFRNYLSVAEKDELETLVEKNPNYFYEILPYTYAMGISKKWISIFEKNNLPNIDIDELDNYENDLFVIM